MSDTWDAEEYDPDQGFGGAGGTDKWEGEDEDDVADNWEDDEEKKEEDDEEKKAETSTEQPKAFQRKKKKLHERIAEKQIVEPPKELTPEEQLAEKLKQKKLQEESDLQLAKEAFGVQGDSAGIDGMFPSTEEEFDNFRDAVKNKLLQFEKSKHFVPFLEKLFVDLVVPIEHHEEVKKLGTAVNNIYQEKLRIHKESQKKSKKKGKITLKTERDTDFGDLAVASGGGGKYEADFYDDDFI